MKVIELKASVSMANDVEADNIRKELKKKGTLLINLMSSPGAGKTTFLSATINALKDKYRIGVMEADIDSSVDAEKIEKLGAKSIQVHTDGMCHMDAGMTHEALRELGDDLDIIFLENVGNLICPAEYDTGASKKVMILSVPEGDDKPLKYPLMFGESDALIISKIDALPYFNFSIEKCEERVKQLNKDIVILPLSAKRGDGLEAWISWLEEAIREWKESE